MKSTDDICDIGFISLGNGKLFNFRDMNVSHITIADYASSLSKINRFTGWTKFPYCVTPDMKILTSDLLWIPCGNLKSGDSLLAFDEYPIGGNIRSRRKLKHSEVLQAYPIKESVYEFEMSDGTILKSSNKHPWLICKNVSKNQVWRTTEDIVRNLSRGIKQYMLKFLEPWTFIDDYTSGYLAGIFDGEGSINLAQGGLSLSFSQNPNVVLDKVLFMLDSEHIKYSNYLKNKDNITRNVNINGGWNDCLWFLGKYRPLRLVNKIKESIILDKFNIEFPSSERVEIVSYKHLGDREVIAIETSSKTFFCEGFGSHNSVAQHSILMSENCDKGLELPCLLHDIHESLVGDLAKPVKDQLKDFKKLEEQVEKAVRDHFNVKIPKRVKVIDLRICLTEAQQLIGDVTDQWKFEVEPLDVEIERWTPEFAEFRFKERYEELTERMY